MKQWKQDYDELVKGKSFNWEQMLQIRFGFKVGLTKEQIAVYADEKFDWWQMAEIKFF